MDERKTGEKRSEEGEMASFATVERSHWIASSARIGERHALRSLLECLMHSYAFISMPV